MFVLGSIGHDHGWGELFEAFLAMGAGEVGIDEAADAGDVSGFEAGDGGADLGDTADDFMAGDGWVFGEAPFVAGEVEVRVADAAVEDFDLDVAVCGLAAGDGGWSERGGGAGGGVGFGGIHGRRSRCACGSVGEGSGGVNCGNQPMGELWAGENGRCGNCLIVGGVEGDFDRSTL